MQTRSIWRTFPVFISSTFKDMQHERDHIKTHIIPRLEEKYASRQIAFKVIDLRWGVNTISVDEDEREAKVLKVCLDSVVNNRPFFIALIGDRYGWIPPGNRIKKIYASLSREDKQMLGTAAGKSVTELEIILGALGDPENILPRSLFFFRDEDSYAGMPDDVLAVYSEPAAESRQKLDALKQHIRESCREHGLTDAVCDYTLQWNGKGFGGLDVWGEMVFDTLCREIDEEAASSEDSEPHDEYEEEQARQLGFVHTHIKRFAGREKFIADQKKHLHGHTATRLFIGFSGSGKSAFMSKLYDELSEETGEKDILLFNSAGVSTFSRSIDKVLVRWTRRICSRTGLEYKEIAPAQQIEDYQEKISAQFRETAGAVRDMGYHIIILADALDMLEQNRVSTYMTWLPTGVSFLGTTTPGTEIMIRKFHTNSECLPMPLFTCEEAREMITGICKYYDKELYKGVSDVILSHKTPDGQYAYTSPLWLSLVVNVLFGLDADDFEEVRNMDGSDEEQKIERFLTELAAGFSSYPERLFTELLERAGKDFGKELTMESMAYIALSLSGLREKDLAALLGGLWDELQFTSMRRWFRQLLSESRDKQWQLSHAALTRALTGNEKDTSRHREIAEYLMTLPLNDPQRVGSLFHHLLEAGMTDRLADNYVRAGRAAKVKAAEIFMSYYNRDKRGFMDMMSDAVRHASDQHTAILYMGYFIQEFTSMISFSNPQGVAHAACKMLEHIDVASCTPEEIRWVGAICNQVPTHGQWDEDDHTLYHILSVQIECYKTLLKLPDESETDVLKGLLSQALFKMAQYYTSQKEMTKAFECYDIIDEL